MELPEHYLPVRVSPHIGEGQHYRFMFAECGSHDNLYLEVDAESQAVKFWPQKGQQSTRDLSKALPALPLFTEPLLDEWKQWDHVLNMKNYSEMLNSLKSLVTMVIYNRGSLRAANREKYFKPFYDCKNLVCSCYQDGNIDLSRLTPSQHINLPQMLPQGLYEVWNTFKDVFNVGSDNCLKGFNRDFYGGVLSVIRGSSSSERDVLVHAGGTSFRDLYMTLAEPHGTSKLKLGRVVDKLSFDNPILQVTSPSLVGHGLVDHEGLVCVRQKSQCTLLKFGSDQKLSQKDCYKLHDESLTSVTFSPYLANEILISSGRGNVHLWDLNSSDQGPTILNLNDANTEKWSCSYVGGHPRNIIVADSLSLTSFDHRSYFNHSSKLFTFTSSLVKPEEHIKAATSLEFPLHVVVTDYNVFLVDQRLPSAPVLRINTEFISSPQYVQVLQGQGCSSYIEKLLFVASQQPAELMCIPLTVGVHGRLPTNPMVPWRLSQMGQGFMSGKAPRDVQTLEQRFAASLAGFDVYPHVSGHGFNVYQVDSYGDVFYQTLNMSRENDAFQIEASSLEERDKAHQLTDQWLSALESRQVQRQPKFAHEKLTPDVFNNIFCQPVPEVVSKATKEPAVCKQEIHRNIKPLSHLYSNNSTSRLHLALQQKEEDIESLVLNRENEHKKLKKRMRKINIKSAKEKQKRSKGALNKKNPRKLKKSTVSSESSLPEMLHFFNSISEIRNSNKNISQNSVVDSEVLECKALDSTILKSVIPCNNVIDSENLSHQCSESNFLDSTVEGHVSLLNGEVISVFKLPDSLTYFQENLQVIPIQADGAFGSDQEFQQVITLPVSHIFGSYLDCPLEEATLIPTHAASNPHLKPPPQQSASLKGCSPNPDAPPQADVWTQGEASTFSSSGSSSCVSSPPCKNKSLNVAGARGNSGKTETDQTGVTMVPLDRCPQPRTNTRQTVKSEVIEENCKETELRFTFPAVWKSEKPEPDDYR